MSGRDTAKVPKIFLSFASQDGFWVKLFTHQDWFGLQLGNVIIENYLINERLDFGPLRIWLEQQIDEATVVIAFVSKHYQGKQWTGVEWNKALTEFQRRRLIFVPVMLDAQAKAWWDDLLQKGGLSGLSPDYMYSDFSDAYSERVNIGENSAVQMKIAKLAERIKRLLPAPSDHGRIVDPPVIADPPVNGPDSAAPLTHRPAPTGQSTSPEVVVLGHPTSRFAEDVAAQASALAEAAEEETLRVEKWDDGWQSNSAARGQTAVVAGTPAVFVQPLPAGEASDQLTDVTKTGRRLGDAGIPDAPVVLWLPNAKSDTDFKAAAAAPAEALPDLSALRLKPALRIDAPNELSLQLRAIIRGPVLQIETVGSIQGNPNLEAKLLSRKLSQMFGDIVNGVIVSDSPPWEFWAEQFRGQIAQISGSRVIVAVHDLDVTPSPNPVVTRKSIEKKFKQMQDYVSQTECASKLRFFWAALLYNNRDALPFARYPSGRFNEWRLLSFEPNDDPAGPPVPDPASLGVFRAELCEWAAA